MYLCGEVFVFEVMVCLRCFGCYVIFWVLGKGFCGFGFWFLERCENEDFSLGFCIFVCVGRWVGSLGKGSKY